MSWKFNASSFFVSAFVLSTILAAIGKNELSKKFIVTTPLIQTDTPPEKIDLPYPIQDKGNDLNSGNQKNSLDLKDPANIKKDIQYDPETGQYILNQTIGDKFYRDPTYMSFDDYLKYQSKKSEEDYWQQKSNSSNMLNRKGLIPKVNVNNQLLDRLFGGTTVDIRPNGNIDLTFGGNYQNIQNPTLTEQQRKQGGFNFDMNIQMNVVGKIGDKLKLTTNYNTQSTFDFENQVKLEYTGYQDEIIKKIEAGNVSLPLTGSLITGSQSLFGIKTQLQFGRLTVTSVISQSKSQTENITVQGGAQQQTFSIEADRYDENRNFFLAQYFRNNFNNGMASVPIINSQVNVTKIEVWVTNKTGATTDTRDVVAFMDLGENKPYNDGGTGNVIPFPSNSLPGGSPINKNQSQGASNNLYALLSGDANARALNSAVQTLTTGSFNLQPVQDFEKTYARKLTTTEYTFQSQLGFILLNQQLNPDEVLAVAYQYTYQGKVYQVGEFAQDVPPNPDKPNVLFLKMLKSTSVRPQLPLWSLMMKNVYSIGAYQVNPQDFKLDITYLDPGGGERRFIPAGKVTGIPLLRLLGLDRLNNQQDPQPDGIFDFIPNITINPNNGKVIFPVLEPFGKDLAKQFGTSAADKNVAAKYVYQVLYDSTKTIALQFPEFNRYTIKGTYKSSQSSDISLGAFNVPQGSVKVTAGGQQLQENTDFTVDYNLGRVKIINSGILNSGVPINVSFENNATFGFQTKTLFGTRLDYYINDNFKLGGTYLHLSERPYTKKLNVGDDPIANAIYGLDGSYHVESGFITRLIDKLPMIDTKEKSSINISGEVARLDPGHSKAIGKEGQVYIDDFEGTQSSYDLKFPFSAWVLSSTPNNSLFPEAKLIDDLQYGFKRAKLSWYSIDPLFLRNISSTPANIKNNQSEQSNFYAREIIETEIFKNKQIQTGVPNNLPTFDLNFEPQKKGPYNFQTQGLGFDAASGSITLSDPNKNWGGIMRAIDYNDFEAANIEYIQLWVLDPALPNGTVTNTTGGDLYINLGNVSEDILKDSRLFYENGLPKNATVKQDTTQSHWSVVPKQPPFNIPFDNDPAARQFQDVGYDGRKTADEANFDQAYLSALATQFGTSSPLYLAALNDPAGDDYHYFLGDDYDTQSKGILDRYKKYNNAEGNSPISSGSQSVSSAATNVPESEDLNRDNTLSETEEYFQYKISMRPNDLVIGKNFVTDRVETDVSDNSGHLIGKEVWYQLKIPIDEFTNRTGGIQDFKSIRFIRMYMTGFDQPVILRFAKMEFIRNQWRKYQFSLKTPGEYIPDDNSLGTFFNVGSVSLEENAQREPINYVIPPGVDREQQIGTVSNVLQNERALQVQVCNLTDGDSRAVYKTINLDMRTFKNLKMFVHAESVIGQTPLNYGDVTAFLRLGSDFVQNYYEYEIPLTISPAGNNTDVSIWPTANNMDIDLNDLTNAKQQRNISGTLVTIPYTVTLSSGARITIVGNPDLGIVKTAMLGIRNPKVGTPGLPDTDDGQPKCTEVWFNEMRLSGFDEQGGYAALARMDVKLADFGTISLSGNLHTIGFGSLEQKLNERYKDNFYQYDASGTFQLGKFIPKKIGIQLPMYIGISKSFSNPKYDPYELDVLLKQKVAGYTKARKDSVRRAAQDYTSVKSLNFTNIRKISTGKNSKLHFYSVENLNGTYAFTQTFKSNPTVLSDLVNKHHAEIGYAFPGKSVFIQPFNKLIGSGKYLKIVKDINLNLLPTNLSFRTAMDRQFGETQLRPISELDIIQPTYNKYFTWDRNYGVKFDLTKSLNVDFNAVTNTRIDEDTGRINTQEKKDSLWTNIKKGGRTTHYHHSTNVSYTLPINKIPILDWIQSNAKYNSDYDWLALPQSLDTVLNADQTIHSVKQVDNPLGNTISNTQTMALSGDFNFRNLYNKWKFLKQFDSKTVTPVQPTDNKDQKKNNTTKVKSNPLGIIIKPILSLKKFSVNYTQTSGTILPGFIYKPKTIGQDFSRSAPGWDFIFGMQPDTNWLNDKAAKGWITTDPLLNYQLMQNKTKNLAMKASLEPIRDFNIDVNFTKNYVVNSKEYFKYSDTTNSFQHLNPQIFGSYSVSYIAIKTAFIRPNSDGFSPLFNTFEKYREDISAILQSKNPNSIGTFQNIINPADTFNRTVDFNKYAYGYGPYSQDVLIPAFIAAYTGKSPGKVRLSNIFRGIPAPNWRVTYNGLSKVNPIKKIFSAFNISHGYSSTFTIGSYNTALDFSGKFDNNIPIPNKIDSLSGNFISYYDIPGVSISEQFSPLIGIDMTWRNRITSKFEYKKSRTLAMSFLDYRMAESKTSEVTIGLGYKWKNAPIPFKIKGKRKRLKNDINMQCNVSYSDNITTNYRLDQDVALPTQGIKTISISPAVDYTVNSRLNIRLFFDKRYSIPATSASYPIRYTNAGVTIRFTLAQ